MQDIETKQQKRAENIFAMLGGLDISKLFHPLWTYRGISKIDVHPDFGKTVQQSISRHDADIAILKFPSIQFTNFINKICMPSTNDVVFGVEGTIVGYGLTEGSTVPENIPKFTQIKSVDQETCFLDDAAYVTLASSRTFCAGENKKTPCIGEKISTLIFSKISFF